MTYELALKQFELKTIDKKIDFEIKKENILCKLKKSKEDRNISAIRSCCSQLGGLKKQWEAFLIDGLTEIAINGTTTSRNSVKNLQTELFGKSARNTSLSKYSNQSKSTKQKTTTTIDEITKIEISSFYNYFKRAIFEENPIEEKLLALMRSESQFIQITQLD